MSSYDPPTCLFPQAINPLNFGNDQAYIDSYHGTAPSHLGISIFEFHDEDLGMAARSFLKLLVNKLCEKLDDMIGQGDFSDCMPTEVNMTTFESGGANLSLGWQEVLPNASARWHHGQFTIFVSFSDGDIELTSEEMAGMGLGTFALQECILVSGSADPSTHAPLLMSLNAARIFQDTVGTLFECNIGVWRESLVPLWNKMMAVINDILPSLLAVQLPGLEAENDGVSHGE